MIQSSCVIRCDHSKCDNKWQLFQCHSRWKYQKLELISSFKEASIGDGEFMRARNVLQKLDTRNAKSKTFNFDLQLSRTLEIDLQEICVKNVFVSNGNENIGGEFTAT